MTWILLFAGLLCLLFALGPRPKLNATKREHQVPDIPLDQLDRWLTESESQIDDLVEGTEACIQWADTSAPAQTDLSFLYLHGFSATWHETAPVTEQIASQFQANVVQGRIAGHGTGASGMLTPSEEWLQSTIDQFEIAQRIGKKVVIVATSTGAPLAVWLATQSSIQQKLHACLFMSPNFRTRSPFGFLLTWPWSKYWIQFFLGKERRWEPSSEAEARCWTHQYSTLSLIQMQKTVDWANKQNYENIETPLAMMYMENDATIYPPAAIKVFERWGGQHKQLSRVTIDGDAVEHVFAGNITAPHRIDWSVREFTTFLQGISSI